MEDAGLTPLFQQYFVRYMLPGLNMLAFGVVVPLARLDPDRLASITAGQVILLVLGSLVAGFMLDSLRVFRSVRGYRLIHDEFFRTVGEEFSRKPVEDHGAIARGLEVFDIFRIAGPALEVRRLWDYQERWVMLLHSSRAFVGLSLIWPVSILLRATSAIPSRSLGLDLFADSALLLVYALLAWRTESIGIANLIRSNRTHLNAFRRHRESIEPFLCV